MLYHAATRSLVLQAPDPFLLRELIPRSKLLSHKDFNVAVEFSLDSARLLRNLGFEPPNLIMSGYRWPGKFVPFSHQRTMAEFWVTHKRGFNLSDAGCVSADTEYLSPTGWRRIDSYTGGAVAQYWPETGEIEFVEPTDYVKLPCPQMIRFQTKTGVDQLLSPEHRVLLADGRVVSAAHVLQTYGTQSMEARSHKFRTTFAVKGVAGLRLTDAQIRLQIAANADGWFPENGIRCYIRLKRARKIERMRQLLLDSGVDYWERPCKPDGFVKFSFEPPMSKGFSAPWWQATDPQLRIVVDEVTHWDGHMRKAGGRAFSGTRQDGDFIQYAYSATGRRASMGADRRSTDLVTVHAADKNSVVGVLAHRASGPPNVRWEPSPDGFKYCFMVPSTFLLLRRNGCIVATGNTGKTNGALWAADFLMGRGDVHKALILAPLSTVERIWTQDIFDTLMHRRCAVVHGPYQKRLDMLAADVDFYILNHDGVKVGQLAKLIHDRTDIDLVIMDEGDFFCEGTTEKYKVLKRLLRPDIRLWWQTATPAANRPTQAWAQARVVNPSRVPEYFGTFQRQTMIQVTPFKWAPRPSAETAVYAALQPAIRFKKSECLDLPPVVTTERQVELTKEQRTAYASMVSEMRMEEASGNKITAVNAADKLGKLRQILLGAILNPETGEYVVLDHAPRLNELRRAIGAAAAKAIVIVPYKGIVASLASSLSREWSVAVLNGDVSIKERNRIIREFKTGPDPHVLICHPRVMSHGLNLVEADTTIFYGPISSNAEYQQVIERNNRAGQVNHMTIVRIAAHPLEWGIYKIVDQRQVTQDNILKLYQSVLRPEA